MIRDPYAGIRRAVAALRGQADHRRKWPACACPDTDVGHHLETCQEPAMVAYLSATADAAAADLSRIERPAGAYKGCLPGCGTQHATVNGSAAVAFQVHVDGCPNAASSGYLRLPPAPGPDFY